MRSPQHETNLQPKSHLSQAETDDFQADVQPLINPLLARVSSVLNPTAHVAMLQRSPANPQAILQLQRQYGNCYVNRVLQQSQSSHTTPIQAKLTLGAVGDKYEQEADRIAKQVVNQIHTPVPLSSTQIRSIQRQEMPEEDDELMMKPVTGTLQRQEAPEEEDELMMKPMVQRQPLDPGGYVTPELESLIHQEKSSGQPLPDTVREPMEQAFGSDLSKVKIHTNAQSNQINQFIQARAFTTGQDIFFRQGEYNPGTQGGQELIAHELTHVMQQKTGLAQRSLQTSTLIQRAKKDKNKGRGKRGKGFAAQVNEKLKPVLKIARKIAQGHAFIKHVIDQAEFPGINKVEDFMRVIDEIIRFNPPKMLSDERQAYWSDAHQAVVIINPKARDGGTAFKPGRGKKYYNSLR